MERKIKKRLARYQKRVERLIAHWKKLDETARLKRPANGGWSITETLVHLELVQDECLKSMQSRFESGIKKPGAWKYTWRFIRLRMAMKSDRKFKAPAIVQPPASEDFIRNWQPEAWLKSLDHLELFFDKLPPNYHNILLFRHPLAGPILARHALIFLLDHLEHHEKKLKY